MTNMLDEDGDAKGVGSDAVHPDGAASIGTVPGDEIDNELHFPRLPADAAAGKASRRRQLTAMGGRMSLVLTAVEP